MEIMERLFSSVNSQRPQLAQGEASMASGFISFLLGSLPVFFRTYKFARLTLGKKVGFPRYVKGTCSVEWATVSSFQGWILIASIMYSTHSFSYACVLIVCSYCIPKNYNQCK